MINDAHHISTHVNEYDYDYNQLFKAFTHAWLIPFALAFISPVYSIVYLLFAALIYSTVFRSKSDVFWGVMAFNFLASIIMMMPG